MKVIEFNQEVKEYLIKSGRKQSWLRSKMVESGVLIAQSSLSERITGILPFLDNEIKVIKSIMKKHK